MDRVLAWIIETITSLPLCTAAGSLMRHASAAFGFMRPISPVALNAMTHLVEGLLLALVDIDEVIQVIRSSEDAETAKTRLMQVFDLDEIQAQYILDLRLRRLTKMSRIELEAERDDLRRRIEELEAILASAESLDAVVIREMDDAVAAYGSPRPCAMHPRPSGSCGRSARSRSTR